MQIIIMVIQLLVELVFYISDIGLLHVSHQPVNQLQILEWNHRHPKLNKRQWLKSQIRVSDSLAKLPETVYTIQNHVAFTPYHEGRQLFYDTPLICQTLLADYKQLQDFVVEHPPMHCHYHLFAWEEEQVQNTPQHSDKSSIHYKANQYHCTLFLEQGK